MNIDIDRLMDDLAGINAIGALDDGGNSRPAFSPADREGRAFLIERMMAAGLEVREDPSGNIFGRRPADTADTADTVDTANTTAGSSAAILVGSHIDTIPRGGRFDGVLGVFGALECVRRIDESGIALPCPVDVVAFADEEERFLGFLGSYACVGAIGYDDIADRTDQNGVRIIDAMSATNLEPRRIGEARFPEGAYRGFIELHIEQGPLLEANKKTIGVVVGVKGNYRWGVTIVGRTDHAGAPRHGRRDAFEAFHRIVDRLYAFRDAHDDGETTLTIGRIEVDPNIETAQPGKIDFSVDFRSPHKDLLVAADTEVSNAIAEVSRGGDYTVTPRTILLENPVAFDETITGMIQKAANNRGYPWRTIQSGAGHDAQVIGQHIPTAMIFVPSVGGRSHCPEEFTEQSDIEAGVNTLLDTLIQIASLQPYRRDDNGVPGGER